MDKICRVTVLLEDSSKVVNFLLKVVLHVDSSSPVVKTSHHTFLHMGQIVSLEVEIPVHVCRFPVDRDVKAAILSSPE